MKKTCGKWKGKGSGLFALILAGVFITVMGMGVSRVQARDFALSGLSIENQNRVVGIGVGVLPDYEGSDDYTIGMAPFFRYQFQGTQRYLMLRATELQANVLNHPWLRMGPSINYRFGRSDVEDDKVDKMEDIDGALELGGFIGVEFVDKENPRKRFLANLDVLQDVTGNQNGLTATLSARVWYPVVRMVDVTLGAGLCYANSNYMDTFFGVSRHDARRSGLDTYNAGAGIKDFRITPGMVVHLSPHWHIAAGVQYRRLVGDAADSPVVDDRGSADQWFGGIGVAYSW